MKSKRPLIPIIFIVMIASTCILCQGKKTVPPAKTDTIVQIENIQDSMEFIGYSIHLVKLPVAYETKDAQGKSKRYTEAWLVKFELKNMPRYSAQRIDFSIGDYPISEYGGWEKGIYFRIYEKKLLEKLSSGVIRFRMPSSDTMIFTKQKFEMPASKKFDFEDEAKVLGKN